VESNYRSSSGVLVRFLAALAASIVTGSLFGAVVLGLTGDGAWSLLAHDDGLAAQAAVQPA
jgi:hypothetical protein